MHTIYEDERTGQLDFFNDYLPLIDHNLSLDDVLVNYTDGVIRGNILEFKKEISNLNSTLFQTIKYLSNMRIKGKNIPKWIHLISLNEGVSYMYDSSDYLKEIEEIYIGGASVNNNGFTGKKYKKKFRYRDNQVDQAELINKLREISWTKVNIDENCIVGYAERYYRENEGATKASFIGDEKGKVKIIGEIRSPHHFKDIIKPYTKETNVSMAYVMDRINDTYGKKALGAFYTPDLYAVKSHELVYEAIRRHQNSGNSDYVIIDASAGTGNLQIGLNDNVPEDIVDKDVLKHCILSTYEYYEWKVLLERIGDKVRNVIPPTETPNTFMNGFVRGSDALSESFINNEYIKGFINDPNCTVILFENPPYRDDSSGMTGIKSSGNKEESFILNEMRQHGLGGKTNEIANRFIWRAFEYYVKKPEDSYIVYAPLKYWKYDNLIEKEFIRGFLFNKKYFHASPSAISCVLWGGSDHVAYENIELETWDIDPKEDKLVYVETKTVPKASKSINDLFDKESREDDYDIGWFCKTNGMAVNKGLGKSYLSDDILGYLVGRGFGISNPNLNFNLLRLTFNDKHGFYLRKSNYLEKLPLIAIKKYLMTRSWDEVELVGCSMDKGDYYTKDKEFLKACFIFACIDYYNKCLSLEIENKIINNQLCFDDNTFATQELKKFNLSNADIKLLKMFENLLVEAKKTDNYNDNYSYGVYQIDFELNTQTIINPKTGEKKYDYPELNTALIACREATNDYYNKFIREKLIKYELIK